MFESLSAIFAIGTIPFWLIIVSYLVVCSLASEWQVDTCEDSPIGAMTWITIILCVFFYFVGPLKALFTVIAGNPLVVVIFFAVYFAIGVAYSLMRFFGLLNKIKRKYLDFKEGWLLNHFVNSPSNRDGRDGSNSDFRNIDLSTLANSIVEDFVHHLKCQDGYLYTYVSGHMSVSRFRSRIVTWIIWWPVSAAYYLLNDPLVRFANYLFDQFRSIYAHLYKMSLGKLNGELSSLEKTKVNALSNK